MLVVRWNSLRPTHSSPSSVSAGSSAVNQSGARYSVLLAPKELEAGNVAVKDLVSGEQREIRRDEAAAWLRTRLDSPVQ